MRLQIGNLVKVRYPEDKYYDGEQYIGIIVDTKTELPSTCCRMWCFQTSSHHIIDIFRDEIEVLNT